jgi:nitroreductase
MADILDAIFKRRSVRVYERKPVEKEKLVDLLKAAMAAPSASNSRPWESTPRRPWSFWATHPSPIMNPPSASGCRTAAPR